MEIEVKNYENCIDLKKKESKKIYSFLMFFVGLLMLIPIIVCFDDLNDLGIQQITIILELGLFIGFLICLFGTHSNISNKFKLTQQYALGKIKTIHCKEINYNGLTTLFVTYNDSKTEEFYVNCKINPEIKQPYYDGKRNQLIIPLYQK